MLLQYHLLKKISLKTLVMKKIKMYEVILAISLCLTTTSIVAANHNYPKEDVLALALIGLSGTVISLVVQRLTQRK